MGNRPVTGIDPLPSAVGYRIVRNDGGGTDFSVNTVTVAICDDILREGWRGAVTVDALAGNGKTGEHRAAVFLEIKTHTVTRIGGDDCGLDDVGIVRILAGQRDGLVVERDLFVVRAGLDDDGITVPGSIDRLGNRIEVRRSVVINSGDGGLRREER